MLTLTFCHCQLQVIAYNSAFPELKDTTHLTIAVGRNLNVPVFAQPRYTTTVDEHFPLGKPIVNISATDRDEVCLPFLCLL